MRPNSAPISLALALALALAATPAARAAEVSFEVRDRLAADEIEELTGLYIDGQLVRSFHLGDDERDVVVTVTVADPGEHDYGLCGHLRLRGSDGSVREQVVDVIGTISSVGGRTFEAVATDDFSRFFLVDTTPGQPPATITPRRGHACAPAVS